MGIAHSTPPMGNVKQLAFRRRQISVKHSNNFLNLYSARVRVGFRVRKGLLDSLGEFPNRFLTAALSHQPMLQGEFLTLFGIFYC